MPLIPRELREPVQVRETGERALARLFTGQEMTIGLAAAAAVPSIVEASGVRAAAPANASCAVAFTRLQRVGARLFGIPCTAVGPVEPEVSPAVADARFDFHANPASLSALFSNPYGEPATLTVWGSLGDESRYPFGGFVTRIQGGGFSYREGSGLVPAGFTVPAGAPRSGFDAGTVTGLFFRAARPAVPAVPNWRTAPPLLVWVESGLPWWGVIAAAARGGAWVRRLSWANAARQVRYEPGIGTSRAVAVMQTGAVVTPADFSAAEFLAEDWRVVGDASEPARIDVTDAIFSGSGTIFFVRAATTGPSSPPSGPTDGGDGAGLPQTGEGFVFVRDGVPVLVPARDCKGGPWRP